MDPSRFVDSKPVPAARAAVPQVLSAAARSLLAGALMLVAAAAMPEARAAARTEAAAHPSRALWLDVKAAAAASPERGAVASIRPSKFRALTLDRAGITQLAATAPLERTDAARLNPLIVSLPDPSGGYQRFALVESPVMEAGLAARHPEIKTYAGRGIDDAGANIRLDISPLGLHASVRSAKGSWYIDPAHHLDDREYRSYYRKDLANPRAALNEGLLIEPQIALGQGRYHAADAVQVNGIGFAPGAQVVIVVRNTEKDATARQSVYATANADGSFTATFVADPYKTTGPYTVMAYAGRAMATSSYQVVADGATPQAATGSQLRTYRLALVTDPTYAAYFGGPANVTAAKVALVNRVTQIYETETAIRLVLVNNNDALNLDTDALMTGANGPCGGGACFTPAQVSACAGATLNRNRVVVGLLIGASNYDIGHIALGVNGGGLASLGVVGAAGKAQGCTGIATPVGDLYAVDYVAHEMGHQFSGSHTFNGVTGSCSSGNRTASMSVEPGSGSSIMAYAGICGADNLQSHSDPYWSQRSFDQITTYTTTALANMTEVQVGVLTGFGTDGQQFRLSYGGNVSEPVIRGANYTVNGIKAAIQAIPGWPSGGEVFVDTVDDTTFSVTFGGTLSFVDALPLSLVSCTGGCNGYVGEIVKGSAANNRGLITSLPNSPPVVTAPARYTIPIRTPFALTGSATDGDADILTYLWEQNDRGATGTSAGIGLTAQPKLNGPLFRQFGTRAVVSASGTLQYNSPGENAATTNPTRVFPDMAQILANNTNAATGNCPLAVPATPTAAEIDCFSEFLPTAAYVGTAGVNASPASMNFRLTVRDGAGGVNSANTQLVLAPSAGPFLVTAPNTAVTLDGTSTQTVRWNVANTDVAPVGVSEVKITLSVDGGNTFPYTLAASTPNNGARAVTLPNVGSSVARIKVEAVGNVFFDVSKVNFAIRLTGDINGDGSVTCADVAVVRSAFGTRSGDAGYDARADVNNDGIVNIRDLSYVSQRLAARAACP